MVCESPSPCLLPFLTHTHTHTLISIEAWHLHNHIKICGFFYTTPHPTSLSPILCVSVQHNLFPGEDLSGVKRRERYGR